VKPEYTAESLRELYAVHAHSRTRHDQAENIRGVSAAVAKPLVNNMVPHLQSPLTPTEDSAIQPRDESEDDTIEQATFEDFQVARGTPEHLTTATPEEPTIEDLTTVSVTSKDVPLNTKTNPELYNASLKDSERVQWGFQQGGRIAGQDNPDYFPVFMGRWWSRTPEQIRSMPVRDRRRNMHRARIMETTLGEQKVGDEACSNCKAAGYDCWVYSARGQIEIKNPGDICARCRAHGTRGRCSLSKRTPETKSRPPKRKAPALCSTLRELRPRLL
jgi:hypothetical protein